MGCAARQCTSGCTSTPTTGSQRSSTRPLARDLPASDTPVENVKFGCRASPLQVKAVGEIAEYDRPAAAWSLSLWRLPDVTMCAGRRRWGLFGVNRSRHAPCSTYERVPSAATDGILGQRWLPSARPFQGLAQRAVRLDRRGPSGSGTRCDRGPLRTTRSAGR